MVCDYDNDEVEYELRRGITNTQNLISGIVYSLRADVGFGKRTQDNADEIIGYLNLIDDKLEMI